MDNILFTKAINEGLRYGLEQSGARYFLLLNQDCYLMPDAIERLVSVMDSHPKVGLCAPVQRKATPPHEICWAGSGDAFPFGQHLVQIPQHSEGQMAPYATPWLNGAAMLLRRQTVQDCGLWDENMQFICSDSDYSFTACARNWGSFVVPQAECLHEGGASTSFDHDPTHQRKLRDLKYFCEKWVLGDLYRQLAPEGTKMTSEYTQLVYRNILDKMQI